MPKLILARHGATPYNEAGIWTGLTDIDMSEKGYREIEQIAEFLTKYEINLALSSVLQRARSTSKAILAKQRNTSIALLETELLNEKNYGVFTGKNKQQVRAEVGEEMYMQIRRSWDYKIEAGESLKEVFARVLKAHETIVVPALKAGKSVLISSHNNALRAYVKELENVPDKLANKIELGTAEARVYNFKAGKFTLEAKHAIGKVY